MIENINIDHKTIAKHFRPLSSENMRVLKRKWENNPDNPRDKWTVYVKAYNYDIIIKGREDGR